MSRQPDSAVPEMDGAPPQNIEAEQCTLGSLMLGSVIEESTGQLRLDPFAVARRADVDLKPGNFIRPSHQEICRALYDLYDESKPIDIITLQEELRRRGKLDSCGGAEYLIALVETVPTQANIEHYARIVLYYATLRKQDRLGVEIRELVKQGKSPEEINSHIALRTEQVINNRTGLRSGREMMMGHWDRKTQRQEHKGLLGYTSGFSRLDNRFGGFGGTLFVVLKAKRGSGKTHLMISSAVNCVRSGKAAVLISMDTPEEDLLDRFIAHLSGLNSNVVAYPRNCPKPHGDMCGKCMTCHPTKEGQWGAIADATAEFYNYPIWIDTQADTTPSQIRAYCRWVASQGVPLGYVGIDYAELLSPDVRLPSREQELSSVANAIKNMRDEFGTTFMLLSQVNDDGAERWSKGIGNACDVLLAWQVQHDQDGRGEGVLFGEKIRKGSGTGVNCIFDWSCSRIREKSLDYSNPAFPPAWPWWYEGAQDIDDQEEIPFYED